jgi:phosphohistidine phosphatase
MKILVVMRHAKSSWEDASLNDYERPLNKRGKLDASRMGKLIYQQDLAPQLVISSSAKRARKTAEAAAEYARYDGEIIFTRDFYHADVERFIERLKDVSDDFSRVMIVGHNPGLEELIEELTGRWERMPTAAVASIKLPIDQWSELSEKTVGKLINLWIPRDLSHRD